MKKRSLILFLVFVLAAAMALTSCGGSDGSADAEGQETAQEETAQEETQDEDAQDEEQTEEPAEAAAPEDIVVDKDAGSVTITAQLNGTFFDQSTMHYCVFKDGGMGDKCMFAAYCDSQDFYDAMIEIGGEPWNTTSDKIADGEFTDGQKVDVTLTWDGQTDPVPLADTVKTADGKLDVDMRFSGNKDNNAECGSGCIACLNSCWAGITSNAAYGYNAIDSGQVSAFLDDSIMPGDGTDVHITFTLK